MWLIASGLVAGFVCALWDPSLDPALAPEWTEQHRLLARQIANLLSPTALCEACASGLGYSTSG